MATRYIEIAASATERANVAPALPGKASLVFRTDTAQLEAVGPTGIIYPVASALQAVRTVRTRFTIAQVNAGATIVAAITGFKIRMVQAHAIAIGGAAGAVTTVDILATQGAAGVKLVAFAQANLTQSTRLTAGGTGGTILADGASFVANDAATAVTIGKTGADVTTATHIDVEFQYVLEAA